MGAGKGTFTAAVEVQGQKQLVVSFLHHQAVQRLSHNPLEQQDVVGVTNYLDVGLQVRVPLFSRLCILHTTMYISSLEDKLTANFLPVAASI